MSCFQGGHLGPLVCAQEEETVTELQQQEDWALTEEPSSCLSGTQGYFSPQDTTSHVQTSRAHKLPFLFLFSTRGDCN